MKTEKAKPGGEEGGWQDRETGRAEGVGVGSIKSQGQRGTRSNLQGPEGRGKTLGFLLLQKMRICWRLLSRGVT